MKNKIILKRKDGSERIIKWGTLPHEYLEPDYFDLTPKGVKVDAVSSTLPEKVYKLVAIKNKGFWIWKHTVGHYEEE